MNFDSKVVPEFTRASNFVQGSLTGVKNMEQQRDATDLHSVAHHREGGSCPRYFVLITG